MARLDVERQSVLEPKRIEYAKQQIENLGFEVTFKCDTRIEFEFKGETVKVFPYSGWHAGKTIEDGRGIKHLLKQIK